MAPRSMVQNKGIARIGALLFTSFAVTLFWTNPCFAEYRSGPSLRWSLQLEGTGSLSSRGMRKGNGVVAHLDGQRLVATLDDGSLHVVQTAPQVKSMSVFEPSPVDSKYIECRSSPVLVYPAPDPEANPSATVSAASRAAQGQSYAIYSIIDAIVASDMQFDDSGLVVQPSDNEETTSSRILAVNVDNGSLRWSVQVPGRIQGDVVVGATGLYVSHNIGNVGFLSVIMVDEDGKSADVVATLTFSNGRNGPFGPPTLQRNAQVGDVVIVAESWGQGYSQTFGGLYRLSPSANFEATNGRGNDSYQVQRISSWSFSSVAAPLVDGSSVFLGAAGGNMAGWTGNERNDLSGISSGEVEEIEPRWVYQMEPNPRNASQPLYSTPVIDSSGEYVCAPGVDSDVYCVMTSNGRVEWSQITESQIVVRPLIWEDDSGSVIYTIESLNGLITQFDLYTGETYWQYSCADFGALDDLCQASVEAEFAISPSGNIVYYGDVFGRLMSLEIANFETDAPTPTPSDLVTGGPTQEPTVASVGTNTPSVNDGANEPSLQVGGDNGVPLPTVFDVAGDDTDPVNAQQQAQEKEDGNSSLGIYIGAALGGLGLLIVPIVVFWLIRSGRTKPLKEDDVLVEIIDDFDEDSNPDSRDDEVSTDGSTDCGIEIEYMGSKAIAVTPPRRKKKKRKKSPQAQTPQTTLTLDSIQEMEEEAASLDVQGIDIEAENLTRRFDMAASASHSSSSSSQFSEDERDVYFPVKTGGVVMAAGTNHLELAVGQNYNSNSSPLYSVRRGSNESDDNSGVPPPPPPSATLASSKNQWSWGKILNFGSVQISKDNRPSMEQTAATTTEEVVLKVTAKAETSSETTHYEEPSHRAKTPPVSNHGKLRTLSPDIWPLEDKDQQSASTGSWPGIDHQTLSPVSDLETPFDGIQVKEETRKSKISPLSMVRDVNNESLEEEKKENEETYSQPLSPGRRSVVASTAAYSMDANRDAMSPVSPASEKSYGRVLSPNAQSQASDYIGSPVSPARSTSNLSTDDSLYTSVTGATGGEKSKDDPNLSPLSTNLFERDNIRRERSDVPDDEAQGALSQPDLTHGKIDKFRYLKEEEDLAPDDEVVTAPGFQYMTSSSRDTQKGDKFGRSVRSKRDSGVPFKNKLAKQSSFGSAASGSAASDESPLAAIYNQLASMGQKQLEEKKKHSFKRRSKKAQREETPEPDSDSEQQEGRDTWGNFLQELAEAEQQFFAPTTTKVTSLLNPSQSLDSEDSEVARINDTV